MTLHFIYIIFPLFAWDLPLVDCHDFSFIPYLHFSSPCNSISGFLSLNWFSSMQKRIACLLWIKQQPHLIPKHIKYLCSCTLQSPDLALCVWPAHWFWKRSDWPQQRIALAKQVGPEPKSIWKLYQRSCLVICGQVLGCVYILQVEIWILLHALIV